MFKPARCDIQVHQVARVYPRPFNHSGIDYRYYLSFSPHDCVTAIHRYEAQRGQYEVTKTTSKMIYAVDFHTREFEHFNIPAMDYRPIGRAITHDGTRWNSTEEKAPNRITRGAHLIKALWIIKEVACEWYTAPVANAFTRVHESASKLVNDGDNAELLDAYVNFYNDATRAIYEWLLEERPLSGIALMVKGRVAWGSQRYVEKIQEPMQRRQLALANTSLNNPPPAAPSKKKVSVSKVPEEVRAATPRVGNSPRQVCLSHNSNAKCTFTTCRRAHELVALPDVCVRWIVTARQGLVPGHPSL